MEKKLDYLIKYLVEERGGDIELDQTFEEKFILYRSLVNTREPFIISDEFHKIESEFLKQYNGKHYDLSDCVKISDKIYLFKGDITKLKVECIVNAANSQMLGCFIPNHKCIDNAIHTFSGVALRYECNNVKNGIKFLDTSNCFLSKAFNLPSKYIIHTVGPIVFDGLRELECNQLKECYINCINLALANNIKEIAFCCISTGEYRFPLLEASQIAVDTIKSMIGDKNIKVIFNVFTSEQYDIYRELLQ